MSCHKHMFACDCTDEKHEMPKTNKLCYGFAIVYKDDYGIERKEFYMDEHSMPIEDVYEWAVDQNKRCKGTIVPLVADHE